jgi:anaerobic selenocysteine-containing dehydrogenase
VKVSELPEVTEINGGAGTGVYRTHCARMDHGGCGLLVTVRDGRVVRIQGDPDSPVSHGFVCPKGLASVERLYHPERLLHPLVREGKRGEGKWRRASWEEAMGILSGRILEAVRDGGAQSVLFGQGAPKGLEFFLMMRLANALGSPNVAGPQNVCHMPREIAASITCGFWTEVDYDHPPGCIILWGSNLDRTNEEGTISSRLRRALDRGSRLIVVDPRPTRMARKAEVWLRLRPGTDAALAMGMMRAMVDEGLEDRDFVRAWTVGFPELEDRLEGYPLSRVEEITWVPAEEIRKAVRLYAQARPAAIQWGNALEHTVGSHQAIRAVLSLVAISGNLEVPGGNVRPVMPSAMPLREFVLPRRIPDRRKRMISGPWGLHPMLATVPVQMAIQALLKEEPYPIKAMYLQGTNPMLSYPDSQRVMDALGRVGFLAVADLFMTPTAAMADLVLPAATNFEYDDIGHYGMVQGMLLARPKLVEPPGEAWSDLRILNELGKALGLGEHFWGDESEMLEAVLAPSGLDYRAFCEKGVLMGERRYRSYLEGGFKTPSGKVELLSSQLQGMGLDPLPGYTDQIPGPDWAGEGYPFVMTSAKDPVFFHSGYRQIGSLRKISKDPEVEMAPEAARRLGIEEGEWVRIRTPKGEIRQRARLVPGMDPRVVSVAYGWWFPERGPVDLFGWRESNINVLTSMEPPYNPVVGSVNLRAIPCALEKE